MQTRWYLAAALAACVAFTAPQTVLAQDAGTKKKDADGASGLVKQPTRVERAKEIVRQLEATKKRLEEAGALDAKTRKALDRSIAHAKALTRPAKSGELTDEERKGLVDELAAEIKGSTKSAKKDEKAPGGDLAGWQERAVRRAFEDVELTEKDEDAATKVISDWFVTAMEARRNRDSKGQSDAKRERDRQLKSLLGKKQARKVINNLDRIGGRGGGRF